MGASAQLAEHCEGEAKLVHAARPGRDLSRLGALPVPERDAIRRDSAGPSPKGLHFAGGYRHFEYTLWNWAPSQSDRQTNVTFEKA